MNRVIFPSKDTLSEALDLAMAFEDWSDERDAALEWELRIGLSDPDFIAEVEALAPCRRV